MPGNKRGCQSLRQASLYDFSPFSALDYNLISFGIKRQTILVNNVLPLPRVSFSFLAEGLFYWQTTCPTSQQQQTCGLWFKAAQSKKNRTECILLTWEAYCLTGLLIISLCSNPQHFLLCTLCQTYGHVGMLTAVLALLHYTYYL